MSSLAIVGASGHGRVVADLAETLGYVCVFFDDAWPGLLTNARWPVLGKISDLLNALSDYPNVFVAIGDNKIRFQKNQMLIEAGVNLVSLIHPKATISSYTSIGSGCVVMAGVVVNCDAVIGSGSILNTSCSIDHDCFIAEGVHVSPGAHLAGGVVVESCAWIGLGAVIHQQAVIGSGAIVGMGAVVTKDVPPYTVVVGNPARPLER